MSCAGEDKMVPLVCGEITMDMEVHGNFFFNVTCRIQESVYPFKSYEKKSVDTSYFYVIYQYKKGYCHLFLYILTQCNIMIS